MHSYCIALAIVYCWLAYFKISFLASSYDQNGLSDNSSDSDEENYEQLKKSIKRASFRKSQSSMLGTGRLCLIDTFSKQFYLKNQESTFICISLLGVVRKRWPTTSFCYT